MPVERAPPRETLPCKPAACSPASGVAWAPSYAVSAVHSDSLILLRCQSGPSNLQAPFRSRRPGPPTAAGVAPTEGPESFDYLIAADTKPIFPPLSILSIVAAFLPGPRAQAASEPVSSALLKVSQESSGAGRGPRANTPPRSLNCLCLRSFSILAPRAPRTVGIPTLALIFQRSTTCKLARVQLLNYLPASI